jgi:hypothetical protein
LGKRQIKASLWIRKLGTAITTAALCAAVAGYVSGLQSAVLKKSFSQLRYNGGPKSSMWRG